MKKLKLTGDRVYSYPEFIVTKGVEVEYKNNHLFIALSNHNGMEVQERLNTQQMLYLKEYLEASIREANTFKTKEIVAVEDILDHVAQDFDMSLQEIEDS